VKPAAAGRLPRGRDESYDGPAVPKTIRGPTALAPQRDVPHGGEPSRDTIRDGARRGPVEPADLVGRILKEKYELIRVLAAGAMGVVYEARHVVLQRKFAVKVLSIDTRQQADALPRFKREAELSSSIGHENIVDVIDIDRTGDDEWFLVMELLEGTELRDVMHRAGRLEPEAVVAIARQLGSAIDAAHQRGIVHRDLKPENIFVLDSKGAPGASPTVKILDFGISKVRNAETALTRPGEVIGTPYYMAPEQARGDRTIDHRADLFALGAVYYEALTGAAPFQGKTPNAVLRSILLDEIPSPRERNPDLPDAVCRVLVRALAKDPDERFQSGSELATALERAVAGHDVDISAAGAQGTPARPASAAPPAPSAPVARSRGFGAVHLAVAFAAGAALCAVVLLLFALLR
jgi:serine/threonine-protein kinase